MSAVSTPRPWYFDGWDIFTSASSAGPRGDGHRMVIPLRAINDAVFHESMRVKAEDARLIVAAVNAMDSAGVVFEDDRVGYVEIQINRQEWLAWKEAAGV